MLVDKQSELMSDLLFNTVHQHGGDDVMHLSMVCPRMGEPGNPRELDFVKRTWVGILTSTMVPAG